MLGVGKETRMKTTIAVGILALFIGSAAVVVSEIARESGGSIKTDLGSVVLNEESSLQREWITIHDNAIPADLVGTVGVKTIYQSGGRYSSGDYMYTADYKVKATEDLTAIELRLLTFDVWGDHVRNLSATEIVDLKAGEVREFHPGWNVFSENEASEYYASIAYIARVRTKSGRVIKADPAIVVEEARKFSEKFQASDLEPEPKKK